MLKRGRPSIADQQAAAISFAKDKRLPAPDHLTKAQALEWDRIVNSLPADYFRPSDEPLLAAYCVAASLYKMATKDIADRGFILKTPKGNECVNPAHTLLTSQAASMAQMAVKLRLCPNSRYTDQSAATKVKRAKAAEAGAGRRPWDDDDAPEGAVIN